MFHLLSLKCYNLYFYIDITLLEFVYYLYCYEELPFFY